MKNRFLAYCQVILASLTVLTASVPAHADDSKEYLVKAAFIYNFIKFVEWPGGKAISTQSKIDVCVIGDTPLSDTGKVFAAASTPKLSINLVKENNVKNISNHCHVAFIAQSEAAHASSILSGLQGQPVLLVSDVDGFVHMGGMIGFVMSEQKVKIAINKKAVTSTGLHIDAQILEIAQEVVDK